MNNMHTNVLLKYIICILVLECLVFESMLIEKNIKYKLLFALTMWTNEKYVLILFNEIKIKKIIKIIY